MAQFTIRIPDELRDRIKTAAGEDLRSMTAEIEWLLDTGLQWRVQRLSKCRCGADLSQPHPAHMPWCPGAAYEAHRTAEALSEYRASREASDEGQP
jgi:hypothetical protein